LTPLFPREKRPPGAFDGASALATCPGRACVFAGPDTWSGSDRTAAGSELRSHPGAVSELRTQWNPMLLLPGLLLFRFETRQLFALLFQLPPRFKRFEPDGHRPHCFHHPPTEPLRAHRQDERRECAEPLLELRFGDRTRVS